VLCTSSTNTQTRSLTWCVHRISHRDINPDRIFRASFTARNHPSRGITHRAVSSIASYSHRTASSSRGMLHRAVFSIARHRHRAALFIARYHNRAVSTIARHLHRAALSIARHLHLAVSSIARYRHQQTERFFTSKPLAGLVSKPTLHGKSLVLFKFNPSILPCANVPP
jgi:hypothetical protein